MPFCLWNPDFSLWPLPLWLACCCFCWKSKGQCRLWAKNGLAFTFTHCFCIWCWSASAHKQAEGRESCHRNVYKSHPEECKQSWVELLSDKRVNFRRSCCDLPVWSFNYNMALWRIILSEWITVLVWPSNWNKNSCLQEESGVTEENWKWREWKSDWFTVKFRVEGFFFLFLRVMIYYIIISADWSFDGSPFLITGQGAGDRGFTVAVLSRSLNMRVRLRCRSVSGAPRMLSEKGKNQVHASIFDAFLYLWKFNLEETWVLAAESSQFQIWLETTFGVKKAITKYSKGC